MSNELKEIMEKYVKGIIKIARKNLVQVILYGSYARGEQDLNGEVSDIDIMILVKMNDEKIRRTQKQILDLSYDFDLEYDILLSPVVESIDNYNKRVNYMKYYQNIKNEGIVLNV